MGIGAFTVMALGLALAALAAAAGAATASVSQAELSRWVSYKLRGTPGAARAVEHPGLVLATANAVTTLGVLVAATAVPALLAGETPTVVSAVSLVVVVPVFVTLVYLVPRALGRRYPDRIVARAVPLIERLHGVLSPFVPAHEPSTRTALAAVLTGDSGVLAATDEMAVVSGVLAFSDRPVAELMTPRTEIVAIPEGMLTAEAAHVFAQSGYSRYPVYRGSIDEIVGVARAFDLIYHEPDASIPVSPVLTVPGTRHAGDLMLEMQRGRGHLAVVLDEFGGTAGLVTFEDLLRDLVQELFAMPSEPLGPATAEPAPVAARVLEVDGSASATVLAERFGRPAEDRGVQTVGGLLVQALGRIPLAGERFQLQGLEFDVLAASPTRVERVAVRPGPVRSIVLDRREGGA